MAIVLLANRNVRSEGSDDEDVAVGTSHGREFPSCNNSVDDSNVSIAHADGHRFLRVFAAPPDGRRI